MKSSARGVVFDSDGWLLATASGNEVRLWNGLPYPKPVIQKNEVVATLPRLTERATSTAQAMEASRKASDYIASGENAKALLWSVEALKRDVEEKSAAHRTRISLLRQNLPKLGAEEVRIQKTAAIPKPAEGLYDWIMSPHGSYVAVKMWNVPSNPDEDGERYRHLLQVIDIATGNPVAPAQRSTRQFMEQGIAFSPDERQLAVLQFGDDEKQNRRQIKILDLTTGTPTGIEFGYDGSIGNVFELAFATNDYVIAHLKPGTLSRHMRAWNARSGKELELDEPFNVVHFSPDGRTFVSGWNQRARKRLNTVAFVRNASTLKPISPPLDVRLLDRACFSGDGRIVAIGVGVQIKTFDVATGIPVGEPIAVSSSQLQIALDDTGRRLAVVMARRLESSTR